MLLGLITFRMKLIVLKITGYLMLRTKEIIFHSNGQLMNIEIDLPSNYRFINLIGLYLVVPVAIEF